MRKADLRKSHRALETTLERQADFARRVLGAKRVISGAADKRDLMEAILLRVCARWERFVETQLVVCVNRNPQKLGEYLQADVPAHPSKSLCRALLYGRGYRDFKSCGELKGTARAALPPAKNPFDRIRSEDESLIDEAFQIRNYLSHYSDHARRKLARVYLERYKLRRFREPGQFLAAEGGRRLLAFIAAFQSASKSMLS